MTQIIKILGTGCKKCKQTEEAVKKAVADNNIDAKVEKVEDIAAIMQYNVMRTPAVVVDEVVKISGKVPSSKEILQALN